MRASLPRPWQPDRVWIVPILRHGFLIRAFAAGLILFGVLHLLPLPLSLREAAMLGWCGNVAAYAGLLFYYLGDADPDAMRERACGRSWQRAISAWRCWGTTTSRPIVTTFASSV